MTTLTPLSSLLSLSGKTPRYSGLFCSTWARFLFLNPESSPKAGKPESPLSSLLLRIRIPVLRPALDLRARFRHSCFLEATQARLPLQATVFWQPGPGSSRGVNYIIPSEGPARGADKAPERHLRQPGPCTPGAYRTYSTAHRAGSRAG